MGKCIILQKQRKEKKMPLKRKGKNQSWIPSKRTEWKLIFNKIEVVVMMLNDLHWLVWSIQVLSGFSHFWLVLSPLPYVLALSSACLVAMAHEVFSQLLNNVGSLLGCCWFLIDRHNNSCKKNQLLMSCMWGVISCGSNRIEQTYPSRFSCNEVHSCSFWLSRPCQCLRERWTECQLV